MSIRDKTPNIAPPVKVKLRVSCRILVPRTSAVIVEIDGDEEVVNTGAG